MDMEIFTMTGDVFGGSNSGASQGDGTGNTNITINEYLATCPRIVPDFIVYAWLAFPITFISFGSSVWMYFSNNRLNVLLPFKSHVLLIFKQV